MRPHFSHVALVALACCALSFLGGCGRGSDTLRPAIVADVARTAYGVAHIRADDFRGLGYGMAYAYAQDNVCMFADTLLTVRGERAMYFGAEAHATAGVRGEYRAASDYLNLKNEDSDFFFKGYLDPAALKAGYAAGSQEARDVLAGYAAGYNRYLKDYAGRYPEACNGAPWLRPITAEDMYLVVAEKALHASGEVFAREIVDAAREPGTLLARRAERRKPDGAFLQARLARLTREQLGSNGLAIGKALTASGSGILLGNPHYPWTSTDRFYQMHLTVPGRYDAMGVVLGGIPMIVIGFNKDVAWTHTVTTAIHFTTFKLTLDPLDASGTTYLSDGVPAKMTSKTVEVASLQPDGTLSKRTRTFYFSTQGALMVKADAGIVWTRANAYVLADPNRNNTRLLDQWLGIGKADSVQALKASLDKVVGLPWVNTIAADRNGQILFADASVVPHVAGAAFQGDCLVLPALLAFDGSRKRCDWGADVATPPGIFSPANGPWTIRSDYVGNSNDSYWLSNARALLAGTYSPLYGPVGVPQKLRTRVGFRQMEDAIARNTRFTLADVQALAFGNRVYAAELVLPELLPACLGALDDQLRLACSALAGWDRHANLESRGAVLFREFWNTASQLPAKWQVPFSADDPVNTPRGVNPAAIPAMLDALKAAAQRLATLNIAYDAPLGDYQKEVRNGVSTPLHGAVGDIDGSYNSLHMTPGLSAAGYTNVAWGTSYIQTVTFDSTGPVAQAILLYGQSVDPRSPHYADQLSLYSKKTWPRLPFTEQEIRADAAYTRMTLSE